MCVQKNDEHGLEPGDEKPLRRTRCTGKCAAKGPYYEGRPRLFIWKCRELRQKGECPLERPEDYEI